jgi:hypothetical protein
MLAAALFGEARALAVRSGSIAEARETLQRLADGRSDLVAQEAGLMAGYWPATVPRQHPIELLAAGLLIVSGPVDLATVARWVEIGRKRGVTPMYRAR